jgi:hypothetical protein
MSDGALRASFAACVFTSAILTTAACGAPRPPAPTQAHAVPSRVPEGTLLQSAVGSASASSAAASGPTEPVEAEVFPQVRDPKYRCVPRPAKMWAVSGKRETAEALLRRGTAATVKVHFDARHTGVVVPPHLASDPRLVLQIGHHMARPIPDLALDDTGISATLSFDSTPFACRVPWSAVFALVGDDNKGQLYWADIPRDQICED